MEGVERPMSKEHELFLLDMLKMYGNRKLIATIHDLAETLDSREKFDDTLTEKSEYPVCEALSFSGNVQEESSLTRRLDSTDSEKSEIVKMLTENQKECGLAGRFMRSDPSVVATEIKNFLQLHNISQREVVVETKIKQSHLSQHLGRGTPMADDRRKILYDWYETRKTELQNSNGECRCVREPPKKRKRGGFKWPPAYRKLLEDTYIKNQNPNKQERADLARLVDSYNLQGKSSRTGLCRHTHKVSELQIYNWFANRRRQQQNKKHNTTYNPS